MPANILPGCYRLQFGLLFSGSDANLLPTPKPVYLTNHGDGKQLTVETENHDSNDQEWNILPPLTGEKDDSEDRIIIPAISKEIVAVSQDVVKFPDVVSLIKNLQVWSFDLVGESDDLYVIRSNLYAGLIGSDPLLGVDKEFKKAIIQHIPVIGNPPPRPVWKLIPIYRKK